MGVPWWPWGPVQLLSPLIGWAGPVGDLHLVLDPKVGNHWPTRCVWPSDKSKKK